MRQIAAFIVGLVLGSALMIAVKGHDLEQLYVKVTELNRQVEQLQEKNSDLNRELQNQKRDKIRRVRAIKVIVNATEDFIRLEVEKKANLQCKTLLQANVAALEERPEIVRGLLEGQRVTVGNIQYLLHVDTVMIIGESMHVWINCKKDASVKTSAN